MDMKKELEMIIQMLSNLTNILKRQEIVTQPEELKIQPEEIKVQSEEINVQPKKIKEQPEETSDHPSAGIDKQKQDDKLSVVKQEYLKEEIMKYDTNSMFSIYYELKELQRNQEQVIQQQDKAEIDGKDDDTAYSELGHQRDQTLVTSLNENIFLENVQEMRNEEAHETTILEEENKLKESELGKTEYAEDDSQKTKQSEELDRKALIEKKVKLKQKFDVQIDNLDKQKGHNEGEETLPDVEDKAPGVIFNQVQQETKDIEPIAQIFKPTADLQNGKDEDIEMRLESDEEETQDDNRLQDMDEESSCDEGTDTPLQPLIQPPLPPVPDKVVVKKYDLKQAVKVIRLTVVMIVISLITGEKIPASKVQEHMRIGLLDPIWVEQRDRHITEKMNQYTVYAAGYAIDASLKQLAERRTDIFGVGDEESAIGKKIGEEDVRKDEKVTWDGHTSSVEAATRAASANITLEEQIHQIHKARVVRKGKIVSRRI